MIVMIIIKIIIKHTRYYFTVIRNLNFYESKKIFSQLFRLDFTLLATLLLIVFKQADVQIS